MCVPLAERQERPRYEPEASAMAGNSLGEVCPDVIAGNSWPVLCRKIKNPHVSVIPLKLFFFQMYKNFLTQLCAGNSCWDNCLWWPLSPFLNYLFPRQKFVQPALWVPSYLVLYLTIQTVLILLCDHLPSDSGLPVRVTALLRILFDSICYHVK